MFYIIKGRHLDLLEVLW